MPQYTLKVNPGQAGKRLDLFILQFSQGNNLGFSRTFIQGLIQEGSVTGGASGKLKPHYKIKADDEFNLVVNEKKPDLLKPEDMPLDVVYEDVDLAVINKPAGLVVHPAPGNYEHTLVNALIFHFKDLSDISPQRPGIVHRLDKDTSGLLVVAKNNPSHLNLARQFAKHTVKRRYIAIVRGRVEFDEDVIELPIGRHPVKRKNMSVSFGEKTKYARTRYKTLKRTPNFSLLELEPFTGRTHQIRVHLAFLSYPVLGDKKYGRPDGFSRLALHAQTLGFMHPSTEKFVEFTSAMPQEFKEFLKEIKDKDKNKA